MSNFTLLMDSNKILKITNSINIYQHENIADNFQFLTNQTYGSSTDLSTFTCTAIWIDPSGTAHSEVLTADEELYKDTYLRYTLPIDSAITRYVGNIEFKVQFTKNIYAADNTTVAKVMVLKSSVVKIPILAIPDYYAIVPDESLDFVTKTVATIQSKIDELNTLANVLDTTKADNIAFNDEGDVQLKANDSFIGDAITVAVPGTTDDLDDDENGVIEADVIYQEI